MEQPLLPISTQGQGQEQGQGQGQAGDEHLQSGLDAHFQQLYAFYYGKGLVRIALTSLADLFSLGFTVALTICLLCVDVSELSKCKSESTCSSSLRNYFSLQLHQFSPPHRFYVLCYSSLALGVLCHRGIHCFDCISKALEMSRFFKNVLCIPESSIENGIFPWSAVLEKVVMLHKQGGCLVKGSEHIDELAISACIMRRDNYLIAMINHDIIDLRVPWYFALILPADKVHLTSSLLFCVRFCLLDNLFTPECSLRGWVIRNSDDLSRRFLLVGILHFALLPFLVVHLSVQYFLKNAQRACASENFFSRDWSSIAQWTYRDYNELPHAFEARLKSAKSPATEYIQTLTSLRNQNFQVVIRCIQHIAGSFCAVLLVLSIVEEEALLHIHVGAHNLLWWLGILSTIYIACRSSSGAREISVDTISNLSSLLKSIGAGTHHYYSQETQTLQIHSSICDELATLCPFKLSIFLGEVLSVVLTPIVLCCSLPPCVPSILGFIQQHTTHQPGLGAILDYSLFPLPAERAGDAADNAKNSKLEQSYLSFQQANPQWKGSAQGQNLISRVTAFRQQKAAAASRAAGVVSGSVSFGGPLPWVSALSSTRDFSRAPWQHQHQHQQQQEQLTLGEPPLPPLETNISGNNSLLLRSMLVSLLQAEGVDWQNDHYWLHLFSREQQAAASATPAALKPSV